MGVTGKTFLVVALGSALGAVARYLVSLTMLDALASGFPWATLTVNVAGSFLIGLYATLTEPGGRFQPTTLTRQFVLSGFCGGFTTFSIFSLETLWLVQQGAMMLAGLNVALSVTLWLVAAWIGYRVGAAFNTRATRLRHSR